MSNFQQQQEEHHKPRNKAGGAVRARVGQNFKLPAPERVRSKK
jgi:hypothetical protein